MLILIALIVLSIGVLIGYLIGLAVAKKVYISEVWQWMVDWVFENAPHEVFDELMSSREDYIKAMED